ncbi:MAG: HEPN domain-containing protein [Gemmatimonadaceae bacterium]
MIVNRGVHPPHTHELPKLLAAQPQDTREDALIVGACAKLQSLYPSSRYPELPMPTLDEARIAFESAQLVCDRLLPLVTS